MDNVETAQVTLTVNNHTGTTHVTAASDHDDVSGLELDVAGDLVLHKVVLDRVVDLDVGVRVSDGAAVVGDDVRNALGAELVLAHLAKLEGRLLRGDAVDSEAALDIVHETEVLARFRDGDDV